MGGGDGPHPPLLSLSAHPFLNSSLVLPPSFFTLYLCGIGTAQKPKLHSAVHQFLLRPENVEKHEAYCDAFRERCSPEPRRRFPKSIRRQMLSWLWNHKVDLKNWHLMAYNWNKSPEIGPWRETWAHRQRPLPGSTHPRRLGSPWPSRLGVSPN